MIPTSFFRVYWSAPPNSVTPQSEPFARIFDNRREALEFAHRKGCKHWIEVSVVKFLFEDVGLEAKYAKAVGVKHYTSGKAGESFGDFT